MTKKIAISHEIKLTPRQKAFADHYLVSQDIHESVKKAGYQGNNLSVRASRLKHDKAIKAYLEKRAKELVTTHDVQLVAMANALKDKDQTLIYAIKQLQDCKSGSPTGFKYFELLAKLNQHLNENKTQNLFLNSSGKDITVDEVIAEANEARMILRQIRIASEAPQAKQDTQGEQGEAIEAEWSETDET